jgi:hypothetical protein
LAAMRINKIRVNSGFPEEFEGAKRSHWVVGVEGERSSSRVSAVSHFRKS